MHGNEIWCEQCGCEIITSEDFGEETEDGTFLCWECYSEKEEDDY